MKNILVLLHDDEGQEARIQAALDLTRAVGGHLVCLDVIAVPAFVGDPFYGDGGALLLQDERDRESRNLSAIRERFSAHEDVSWDMRAIAGDIAPALEAASGLADVIVVNRRATDSRRSDLRALAGDLIVKSGKPVVAVPTDGRGFNVAGRAIVAWDGSPQSSAALQAAAPLLKLAECVILIEIDDGSVAVSAREAATYLSRHGIHPLIRFEKPQGRTVAEVLLAEIREREADYLVMGGFGRSRVTEALFGGVTRSLLEQCPVPLFLAHK